MQLDQILDFAICPLKTTFSKVVRENDLVQVYKKLIQRYLARAGCGYRLTARDTHVELNKIWSEHRQGIEVTPDLLVQISNRVKIIPTLLEPMDQLVAINYPSVYSMGSMRLTDLADAVVLRQVGVKKSLDVWILDESNTPSWLCKLRASYYQKALGRIVNSKRKKDIRLRVIDLYTGKDRFFFSDIKNFVYVRNIHKSIRRNLLYPSPSRVNCRDCHASKLCPWSVNAY